MNQLFSRLKLTDSIWIRPISGFILASIILAGLAFYLQSTPLVRDWEHRFQTRFHLFSSYFKAPEFDSSPVVVLLINDQSLPADTSRSPINREWLASLLNRVSSHKPDLVGLNILLDRPQNPRDDQKLADAIRKSGRVIIRSEPLYQPLTRFTDAALDHGTLRFRSDSSGALQEVCDSHAACRSNHIFHSRLVQNIQAGKHTPANSRNQHQWLRIDFSAAYQLSDNKQYVQFPVFFANELDRLPEMALQGKVVLIGTGFADLYPLYRTPLPGEQQFLQETEVLAQIVDMIISDRYLNPLPPVYSALMLLVMLLGLSLLIVKRGLLAGVQFTAVAIVGWFIMAAVAFSVQGVAVPFILPATLLLLFLATAAGQQVLQERFSRLMLELKLKEAKIDFLTNELHTHHLFNELSRLSVMISRQPEVAREYLVEFAELLRASLKYGDQARVPISVQLEYLKTYLQQQAIIHGQAFQFSMNIKGEWETVSAPWHAFYPLVENAVKAIEGILKKDPDQPVNIDISLLKKNSQLMFRVINPCLPEGGSHSTQKGLPNLEDRLKWSYPEGGYHLSGGLQDQTWVATLQLPLK